MLAEIEEIGMIIAPRMFGKKYSELDFFVTFKGLEQSERFRCSKAAQEIRLEALKLAGADGRAYSDMKLPEFMGYCEKVIAEKYPREVGEEG